MKIHFIICLFIPAAIYCQAAQRNNSDRIDSLKVRLSEAKNDSMQAQLLLDIAVNFGASNPDSTLFYGRQAVEVARRIGNKNIAVIVMGFMGDAYHYKGNLPKAIEILLNAIAEAEGLPRKSSDLALGPAFSTLGDIYTDIGDFQQALIYYSRLLDYGDTISIAFGHFGRARVFEQMGNLDSALIELDAAYSNFMAGERMVKDYRVVPTWFNLRAKVYAKQGQIDLALKDTFTALDMTINSNDSYYTANSYNDIAGLYGKLHEADSSIYYAKKGLEEAGRISYAGGMLLASEILASQFDGRNDSEALRYLKLADSTRSQLYGAGNIQVMKDMISQNERRQQEGDIAEAAYQSKLRINALLGIALALVIATFFLIRNNRTKKKANHVIQKAYEDLKNTQSQLIQSEKMASLGELTAGIAHEIQNPLNFVNNFSEVNKELVDDLEEEVDRGDKSEIKAIVKNIRENEGKILHHGKRAEAIVKSMLQHSRTSSGEKELTDINALCDEYLRLAYHGFRAKDKNLPAGQAGFNAEFKTELDPGLPKIFVVPQDIGRVLLNLANNAFQAVKDVETPMVTVSTRQENGKVEIRIKDNGSGIPGNIKDKIFQPFFTTKPTGQGTGLGLSLSYDIVKAHGGEVVVESAMGQGSQFIIKISIA